MLIPSPVLHSYCFSQRRDGKARVKGQLCGLAHIFLKGMNPFNWRKAKEAVTALKTIETNVSKDINDEMEVCTLEIK